MRHYSNTARPTTLANVGGITPTTTNLVLAGTAGFPVQFPFVLRIEPDLPNEELVLVSSGNGTLASPFVVSRGGFGTTAKSHPQFCVVAHSLVAEDLREPHQHIEDSVRHVQPTYHTHQVAEPPYGVVGQFVNFSALEWQRIQLITPAGGLIKVTVGAALVNTSMAGATAWASYRISGGVTLEGREGHGVSASDGRVYASRVRAINVPPNVLITITPTWYISSGNNSTVNITDGQLIVELGA